MCTKKSVLILGLIFSAALLSLISLQQTNFCYSTDWCRNLWDSLNFAGFILFPFPFVFLFSLITYKMRDEVFRAWVKFTTWWVSLQIVLVAITPESSGGFFVTIVDKQLVAIILSGLFTAISLLIVVWKYFSTRRSGQV